ncbi:receptor-like protein 7 isoform X1 [Castanea sativa]|uniref:receptor-like protein 7 isoform X1 n=1 Tax=Castanea sativa TaxID=21020 RepID=UPI003F64CBB4
MASFLCYLMSTRLLFLIPLLHAIATNCFASRQPVLCHDDESSALLQFKQSFDWNLNSCFDPSDYRPKISSWKVEGVDTDCCSWDGVECNKETGHVIGLDLSSSCLYGSMLSNSSLFSLVRLQRLNLAHNNFNFSQIPSGFGHLSRLTYLNLSDSSFSGQIPSKFSKLSKLTSFDLSDNYMLDLRSLKGLVQNLTSLEDLSLGYVQIPSPVPEILANLSSLRTLDLTGCGMYGEFPVGIFKLPKLQVLWVDSNQFLMGNLPEFYSSSPLKSLSLRGTNFSGKLPDSIGNLNSLNELWMGDCNFSGHIPSSLGNLTQLNLLDLSYNSFVGQIPSSLSNLISLNYLNFGSCQLSGSISPSLSNLSQLTSLVLSNNSFVGKIPSSLSNLISLKYLDFSYCQLSGSIPPSLSNLSQLTSLVLDSNSFVGQIPSSLSNLISLNYLDFSSCQLSGPIPPSFGNLTQLTSLNLNRSFIRSSNPSSLSWLGKLSKLTFLDLQGINLTMEIPSSFANLTQLRDLDMGSNQLMGRIPSWLANLTQLTTLHLPFNKLEGSIPISIFELKKLQQLNLYSNHLSGTVTLEMFINLKFLTTLLLSMNKISFLTKTSTNATQNKFEVLGLASCNLRHFPNFLREQDQLQWLDLSYNNIQGQIPKWVWNTSKETLLIVNFSHNFLTGFDQHMDNFPWPQLQILDLRSNVLQALPLIPPPSTLVYLVADNMLQGEVSPLICKLSSLHSLDLSNNKFRGTLPHCLSNFSNSLSILNLHGNNFHGMIPQLCAKGSRMKMIDMSQNQFEGLLPRSLSNCKMLEILNLGSNQLNDVFPSWLGTLLELRVLILRRNGLYGAVGSPTTIFASPKLHILDLSSNKFTGKLPFEYFQIWKYMKKIDADNFTYMLEFTSILSCGYAVYQYYPYSMKIINKGREIMYSRIIEVFATIDLSSNEFNGKVSEFIGNLNGLQLLNLSNNNLTGHIPLSLGELTTLESLDLSQNKLSGQIPWQLTKLTFLGSFNVSNNQLTGLIPHGYQFDTFENSSFAGNLGLCGKPLSKKCENHEQAPLPSSGIKEVQDSWFHMEFDWKIILPGYVSGLIIGVVVGNVVTEKMQCWFVRTRRRQLKR